ncbi:hypothetical protein BD780_000090 [Clostridium tetanomorphum]|nr:hypothetical protein [Clostridium tetanomorphum]NRS82865.1 hypothetical protein [Clostridium tetanomorphum]
MKNIDIVKAMTCVMLLTLLRLSISLDGYWKQSLKIILRKPSNSVWITKN